MYYYVKDFSCTEVELDGPAAIVILTFYLMGMRLTYRRRHLMHIPSSILKCFAKPAFTSTTYLIGPSDL